MNTTAVIVAKLTLIANNAPGNPPYKRICIEAADRLNTLHKALGTLLEDKQYACGCGSMDCPVMAATRAYCLGGD